MQGAAIVRADTVTVALPQKYESHLDRVSTGSGSDLVSDRHAIFAKDLDSDGWTRSLPLPCTDPIQQ